MTRIGPFQTFYDWEGEPEPEPVPAPPLKTRLEIATEKAMERLPEFRTSAVSTAVKIIWKDGQPVYEKDFFAEISGITL